MDNTLEDVRAWKDLQQIFNLIGVPTTVSQKCLVRSPDVRMESYFTSLCLICDTDIKTMCLVPGSSLKDNRNNLLTRKYSKIQRESNLSSLAKKPTNRQEVTQYPNESIFPGEGHMKEWTQPK